MKSEEDVLDQYACAALSGLLAQYKLNAPSDQETVVQLSLEIANEARVQRRRYLPKEAAK